MQIVKAKRLPNRIMTAVLAAAFVSVIGLGITSVLSKANAATSVIEAESFGLPSWAGLSYGDQTASAGNALLIWSNATATSSFSSTQGNGTLQLVARADLCSGSPQMKVSIDGTVLQNTGVDSINWTTFTIPVNLSAGAHTLQVAFTNDTRTSYCDRNLRVDKAIVEINQPLPQALATSRVTTPTAVDAPYQPLNLALDVDTNSLASQQAATWRQGGYEEGATVLSKIASQPEATWFGGWSGDIKSAISTRVSAAASRGGVPVLVAYNIPNRDCGGYSSGGTDPAGYKTWIQNFADGLGGKRAIVVLEPDALALTDCLSTADKQVRYDLLSFASQTLSSAGAIVYIDAGHAGWKSAEDMASVLEQSGIANARGFSLNVSNFGSTASQVAYGTAIRAKLGGTKSFVVDTSRNGKATAGSQWCNPWGQALGAKPTMNTGVNGVDAYLWIKAPGESDGSCNGGPSAGQWWLDYAMDLARNASY